MNGYIWFFDGKHGEVYAETLYGAKLAALKVLGIPPMATKRASRVTVMLAELNGAQVTHSTQDIGG